MEYQSIKYNNQWTQLRADTFEGMTSDIDVNCKKLQTYKPLPVENILLVLNY